MTSKKALSEVKRFILQNVENSPKDIVHKAMNQFEITRPAVIKHVKALVELGLIEKTGTTRDVSYKLTNGDFKSWKISINSSVDEDQVWIDLIKPHLKDLPQNVYNICLHGFTEMLNNVIDHSEAQKSTITLKQENKQITLTIADNGIGIFKKVQQALSIPDIRESVLHLSKGKFTTDHQKHTGEGIFFTSRAFDNFSIESDNLGYYCFKKEEDWFIEKVDPGIKGTLVSMTIQENSKTELTKVFQSYTDDEDGFSKTQLFVKFTKLQEERYISRSQAKRLVLGLDKFKEIVLDFQNVKTVGQAFVDQVFRVFQNQNPNITIKYINANEEVEFMIQRGLSTK